MSDASDDDTKTGPIGLGAFLAAAVILFVSILTAYALLRLNDPGAFAWAPKLLDRRLGAATFATFLVACLAGAGALRFALRGSPRAARSLLGVALLAGTAALAVRAIELPSTSRRAGFLPRPASGAAMAASRAPGAAAMHIGDAAQGKRVFLGTCAACHAPDGSGVKGQGQNLRDSTFLKDKSDEKALAFVKAGRQPFDPESKLHLAMPARGGNPSLTDASLLDTIAYVRELEKQAASAPAVAATAAIPAARVTSSDQPQVIDGELWLPHSILPAAQSGPPGLRQATIALQKPNAEGHDPGNVRRFFSVVLFVNGLHAIYVLFGVVLATWVLITAGRRTPRAATLAMVATYWVVISGIGLLLVPAFFL